MKFYNHCVILIGYKLLLASGLVSVVKGKPTGSKIKALDGNEFTGSAKWLYQASYYDDRYRIIQSRRTLFDYSYGGIETQANLYDFTGRLLQNKTVQTFNGSTTTVDKYLAYDSQGRLTKTEQEIEGDDNGKVTVSENLYNETGQLVTKKLHKSGLVYLQNVDYTYNLRGWLTSINNSDNLSGDLFAERVLYEAPESALTSSADIPVQRQYFRGWYGTAIKKPSRGTGSIMTG